MRRGCSTVAATAAVIVAGCTANTAPGNDREAQLDPPARPAEVMPAGAALQGIATSLVIPQTMTAADLENVPDMPGGCMFRMTGVGEPVVVYGPQAVVKLNGHLVPLPAVGSGRYGAEDVTVVVRPLNEPAEREGSFAAEFVLRLPGAPHELGYHGFAEC